VEVPTPGPDDGQTRYPQYVTEVSELKRSIVNCWSTKQDQMTNMNRTEMKVCNQFKQFLNQQDVMLWFHGDGSAHNPRIKGHYHMLIVLEDGVSHIGEVKSYRRFYQFVRKLCSPEGNKGRLLRSRKVTDLSGMVKFLQSADHKFLGSRHDSLRRIYNKCMQSVDRPQLPMESFEDYLESDDDWMFGGNTDLYDFGSFQTVGCAVHETEEEEAKEPQKAATSNKRDMSSALIRVDAKRSKHTIESDIEDYEAYDW
jgi:hypothetical protein